MKPKAWRGICSRACWTAKEKWCRCRCKGAYHGVGLPSKGKSLDRFVEETHTIHDVEEI